MVGNRDGLQAGVGRPEPGSLTALDTQLSSEATQLHAVGNLGPADATCLRPARRDVAAPARGGRARRRRARRGLTHGKNIRAGSCAKPADARKRDLSARAGAEIPADAPHRWTMIAMSCDCNAAQAAHWCD